MSVYRSNTKKSTPANKICRKHIVWASHGGGGGVGGANNRKEWKGEPRQRSPTETCLADPLLGLELEARG